jgi:hypothetical protein
METRFPVHQAQRRQPKKVQPEQGHDHASNHAELQLVAEQQAAQRRRART